MRSSWDSEDPVVAFDLAFAFLLDLKDANETAVQYQSGEGRQMSGGLDVLSAPGPPLEGDSGAAENPYYLWVDQHDTLGLGGNTPIATGNQSDSLHALVNDRIVELRVPYPMGFFAKQVDGRIDDPKAGGKAAACG